MDGAETITSRELAASLGTTPQRVSWWIRKGMPFVSRNGVYRFDPDAVEAWLTKEGIIALEDGDQAGRVVRNRADVANHFGCNEHTVSSWQRRPGFPGRPATPGRHDGHYPLDEIEEWLQQHVRPNDPAQRECGTYDDTVKSERARLLGIQCEERELRLRQKRDELVGVEVVTAFMARVINQAAAVIDEIPDRVLSHIPQDVAGDARKSIRDDLVGLARDLRMTFGELAAGDMDESADFSVEDGLEAEGDDPD